MSLVFEGLTVSHHSAMKCWIASRERGHCVLCSGLGAYNTNIIYVHQCWNQVQLSLAWCSGRSYLPGPSPWMLRHSMSRMDFCRMPAQPVAADGRGTKKWSFGNCHVFWSKEVVYKTFRTALAAVIYAGILDSQVPLALLKRHDTW